MAETATGNPAISEAILLLLRSRNIPFVLLAHEPTKTSEESARLRNEPLSNGAKAMVVRLTTSERDRLALIVIPADRKLSNAKVRRYFQVKSFRFASREDLRAATGLVPGSVPPFGHAAIPLLPYDMYVDRLLQQNRKVAFNCGDLTQSVVMATADYVSVCTAAAEAADFVEE